MRARPVSRAAIIGGEEAEEAPRGPGGRKKGIGVRAWLLINASGETHVVEAGRHTIMRRTGLPARDLRILDPQLSYPSSILGRERAIVINLEHIKAIITANEVLLLNSRDPAVAPFVEELQRRLARQEGGNSDMDMEFSNKDNLRPTSFKTNALLSRSGDNGELPQHQNNDENNLPGTWQDSSQLETNDFQNSGPKVLPFEFRALEACLEAACSCLESETRTLEEEAYPALDELTSKISTLNLERVRQIKSRLVAISGRVQKVRDELEHLLDDDEDMAEMYLTDKFMQQHLDGFSSPSSFHGIRGGIDYELTPSDAEDGRLVGERNTDSQNLLSTSASGFEGLSGTANALKRDENSITSSSIHSGTKILDVEELEMLLEAYFVQIDGTLNKLSTRGEATAAPSTFPYWHLKTLEEVIQTYRHNLDESCTSCKLCC